MKGDNSPTLLPAKAVVKKDGSEAGCLLSKTRYKFWVLGAILLLAFWSMFTGSVTLKWSAGNLTRFSREFDSSISTDLDVVEVEEQEKVVRHMWNLYTHHRISSKSIRLPRFWLEAFEAAYEDLISAIPGVRDAAVSEIAKISLDSIHPDPLPLQSKSASKLRKNGKHAEEQKEVTAATS